MSPGAETRTTEERERARAEAAGQEHVFRFWDELGPEGRQRLLSQLAELDYDLVSELAGRIRAEPEPPGTRFEPPNLLPLARGAEDERRAREGRGRGERLLAAGEVGYVLVAGGQASRLGYEGPKGCFPVGPVSRAPLFRIHAHRLRAAAARHGTRTPWYVMTSPANDAETRRFFDENERFELPAEDVHFFSQAMLPALDEEGRILLAAVDSLFLAPNGHGGVLAAMRDAGVLDDARARGLRQLSYFQVDNPLARPADPVFLGLHDLEGAGMSTKVVAKRDPAEKVGVIGRVDGRMGCIEYSDLPDDLRHARDGNGELAFRAGNIAIHGLAIDFVGRLTSGELSLPWHRARKKVRVVDEEGREVERTGYKFETFVFDALGHSERSVTMEVDRAREFSPVKNAEGEDSPATARRDLCRLFAGWAARAGKHLPEPDAEGVRPVEVDPLVAETEEEFRARDPEPDVRPEGHLYAPRSD